MKDFFIYFRAVWVIDFYEWHFLLILGICDQDKVFSEYFNLYQLIIINSILNTTRPILDKFKLLVIFLMWLLFWHLLRLSNNFFWFSIHYSWIFDDPINTLLWSKKNRLNISIAVSHFESTVEPRNSGRQNNGNLSLLVIFFDLPNF